MTPTIVPEPVRTVGAEDPERLSLMCSGAAMANAGIKHSMY